MQARNLIVLVLCQLITATGTIVVVTLGPPGSLYGEWRIRGELESG